MTGEAIAHCQVLEKLGEGGVGQPHADAAPPGAKYLPITGVVFLDPGPWRRIGTDNARSRHLSGPLIRAPRLDS